MSVLAYHPETGHTVLVEDGAMDLLRRAGWLAKTEHDERQALAAQAAADADAQAAKTAAKTAKNA